MSNMTILVNSIILIPSSSIYKIEKSKKMGKFQ